MLLVWGLWTENRAQTPQHQASALRSSERCTRRSVAYLQRWDKNSTYIPDSTTPLKTLTLNFRILQSPEGTGNFQNAEPDLTFLHQIFRRAADIYRSVPLPSDPQVTICGACTLQHNDSRIRLELGSIAFIPTEHWNDQTGFYTHLDKFRLNPAQQINVFFVGFRYPDSRMNPEGSASMPSFSIDYIQEIMLYTKVYNEWRTRCENPPYEGACADWTTIMGSVLAHEMAHVLDLCHNYPGGGCSTPCSNTENGNYFEDVFGKFPGNCPHINDWQANPFEAADDRKTNNIVGGDMRGGYISPEQAGRMHRALSLTSARKYAQSSPSDSHPIEITTDEIWDFNIRLYQDVIVRPGASLTVQCRVEFPVGGRLVLEPGATLTVDGGTLTCSQAGLQWYGIELRKSKNRFPRRKKLPSGRLILKTQGVIEQAMHVPETSGQM